MRHCSGTLFFVPGVFAPFTRVRCSNNTVRGTKPDSGGDGSQCAVGYETRACPNVTAPTMFDAFYSRLTVVQSAEIEISVC